MKRYVIERDIPGVGKLGRAGVESGVGQHVERGPAPSSAARSQWLESFMQSTTRPSASTSPRAKPRCSEHARLSGFPASKITEVRSVVNPMSAQG